MKSKKEKNGRCLEDICMKIPKAELHIHIEGTFEPELMMKIAARNKISLPYKTYDEVKAKYEFQNLQEFLDIYYANCAVLLTELDFHELMYAYLMKASSQGLKYAEIFFDPQTHLNRGVNFEVFFSGLRSGMKKAAQDFGIESHLIVSFLRNLPLEDAEKVFELALPFKKDILGVGLDSSEIGFPPQIFKNLFENAKNQGFRLCCHAAEEGPPENISECLLMGIERVDHGIKIFENEEIMKVCSDVQIPLTLCPLSNQKLKVTPDLKQYPLRTLMGKNLLVMINSDDPAYFGGYIGDNFFRIMKDCDLSIEEIVLLAKNSFKAAFLPQERKEIFIRAIDEFMSQYFNE